MKEINRAPLFAIVIILFAASCGGAEEGDSPEDVGEAALASVADGPFASIAALQAYWQAQPGSACLNVYMNGHNVYSHGGFGPCYEPEYFQCADKSGIKAHCGSYRDGDASLATVVSEVASDATIWLDSKLYRQGSNPYAHGVITTCYGDPSFNGHIRYFRLTSFNNGFGNYSASCYP